LSGIGIFYAACILEFLLFLPNHAGVGNVIIIVCVIRDFSALGGWSVGVDYASAYIMGKSIHCKILCPKEWIAFPRWLEHNEQTSSIIGISTPTNKVRLWNLF